MHHSTWNARPFTPHSIHASKPNTTFIIRNCRENLFLFPFPTLHSPDSFSLALFPNSCQSPLLLLFPTPSHLPFPSHPSHHAPFFALFRCPWSWRIASTAKPVNSSVYSSRLGVAAVKERLCLWRQWDVLRHHCACFLPFLFTMLTSRTTWLLPDSLIDRQLGRQTDIWIVSPRVLWFGISAYFPRKSASQAVYQLFDP